MRFNRFIFCATAAIALLASCKEKEDPTSGEASITLKSESSIILTKETQSVNIEFVTNREWTASAKGAESWLNIAPASGSASSDVQKVTVTVTPNDSYDRSATITISIGVTNKKVTINQSGSSAAPDGSKNNPFNVAAAVAKCEETGETVTSQKYYIKGIISNIKSVETEQYGNANFYITDDGQASDTKLYVFQCLYLAKAKFTSADQIKEGDKVIIYSALVNYYGNTPETDGKGSAYIYSLNGETGDSGSKTEPKGTGTEADPFNAAAANEKCEDIGSTASKEEYYVKGIISSIKEISTDYGNATFYISDDGSTTLDQFYVFHAYSFNGEKFVSKNQLKVGDEVVVKGKLVNYYYYGNTPEMTNGQLVSVNGGQDVSYLSVDKPNEVSSEAGELTLNVFSNQSWTASTEATWLTVSPASGENDGTVVLKYEANSGDARSAEVIFEGNKGSKKTVTLNQVAAGAQPFTVITWKKADWTEGSGEISLAKGEYTIVVKKNNGQTPPAVRNNGDIRSYAKATIEVSCNTEMTNIEFILAEEDPLSQYSEITADQGTVGAQSNTDEKLSWTGSSSKVVFTVGSENKYGTDTAKSYGQFRFSALRIK